jgi:hypothetical protein
LLALAANAFGVAGVAVSIVAGVISLLSESDSDQVLSAIDQLRQELEMGIAQLGDLINKQTQRVIENEDDNAIATAISHTNTALDKLDRFVRAKDGADLQAADTESDLGVQFFLALPADRPDPFFLPGLVKAGTVRILVIVAQDPNFRSLPDDTGQISALAERLAVLIGTVKESVEAAHTLMYGSSTVTCPIEGGTVPGGPQTGEQEYSYVAHASRGRRVGDPYYIIAVGVNDPCAPEGYPEQQAVARAQSDRDAGVAAELQFLSIPKFESLLGTWRGISQ